MIYDVLFHSNSLTLLTPRTPQAGLVGFADVSESVSRLVSGNNLYTNK